MQASVSGMDELLAGMESAAAALPHRMSTVVRKTAHDVEATAKQLVPVDTGATKNSIGVDASETDGEAQADVGPQTWYAPLLEAGTERMPPRPFMGQASDAHEPAFVQAVAETSPLG